MFADLSPRDTYADSIGWHLKMLRESRAKYDSVGKQTGVPWHFIGVIHALEASFNFRAHLHNGDHPLSQRTRQVPSGRPLTWLPPADWESSAKDALRLLGFTGKTDWTLERTLYRLEAYNGFGYRRLGVPTPYLWSFSSHYEAGKFVADGKFNTKARSQQCGTAVMLKMLADAGDIVLNRAT
jgi:lysozyme family protein